MSDEGKKTSSQNILNIILVIICGALMGWFIYENINKNDQLAEYRKAEMKRYEKERDADAEKIKKLANIFKETSYNNQAVKEIITTENGKKVVKLAKGKPVSETIADDVSKKIDPALKALDKKQGLTDKKLDKIMNELLSMLEEENKKSVMLRKEMQKAIKNERQIEENLSNKLGETQKIVADMNGLLNDLKARYLAEVKDDSAIGDIIRCASAPAEFLRNTLTFDWFNGSDKSRAAVKYDIEQKLIMDRYNLIDDPKALKRLKEAQSYFTLEKLRRNDRFIYMKKRVDHNNGTVIEEKEIETVSPEVIQ